MQKASVLMPLYPGMQVNEKAVLGVMNQTVDELELLVLDQRPEEERKDIEIFSTDARIVYVAKTFKNDAALYNYAFNLAKSSYLITLPKNVEFLPNTVEVFRNKLISNPKLAMVYSDYTQIHPDGKKEEKVLFDYIGDITERANFGFVRMYRLQYVFEVGGCDEQFYHMAEYDLRLKLDDNYTFARINQPSYVYYVADTTPQRAAIVSKLHTTEEGKFGVFSYMFLEKDKEYEIEKAFEDMLRRRGAYLYHEPQVVTYPKGKKWPVMVSVIIPCYNRGAFIGKAIESVLRQTYQNFEIIVVDNGSSDNSIAVVEELMKKDKRIRLIKNNVNVIAVSLNKGLRAAKGKYYAQLDSDDEYAPTCLEKMVHYLETHPTAAEAISYYELIDENSQVIKELGVIKHLEYDRNNVMRVDGAGALRVYHREVVLNEFGGFDETEFGHFGEDFDMNLKISEKYDIGKVHAVCYYYRRHPDNTDVKRDPWMKIRNKTVARQHALARRIKLNQQLAKQLAKQLTAPSKPAVKAKKRKK
ncbi:MAG: glycosyltransferase [bacterium]|nr:glycosyltransferase [bacterium]